MKYIHTFVKGAIDFREGLPAAVCLVVLLRFGWFSTAAPPRRPDERWGEDVGAYWELRLVAVPFFISTSPELSVTGWPILKKR